MAINTGKPEPPIPVPTGFTRVQYLYLNGSGYIALDPASSEETDAVELDFQLDVTTAQMRLVGANSNVSHLNVYINGNGEWAYRRGSAWRSTGIAADTNRHRFLVDHYNGRWSLDGSTGTMSGSGSSSTANTYIGGTYSNNARLTGKLYDTKYWRSGSLLKRYIMLRNDLYEPFVYDVVAEDFVVTTNTGILVGPDY